MQKMIWIPDNLVEGIKEAAAKECKSVSQYLVDLHRWKFNLPILVHDQAMDGNDKTSFAITESVDKKIEFKEIKVYEGKGKINNIPDAKMYSEEYRKKNPMEICSVPNCGKALKFNCGH